MSKFEPDQETKCSKCEELN